MWDTAGGLKWPQKSRLDTKRNSKFECMHFWWGAVSPYFMCPWTIFAWSQFILHTCIHLICWRIFRTPRILLNLLMPTISDIVQSVGCIGFDFFSHSCFQAQLSQGSELSNLAPLLSFSLSTLRCSELRRRMWGNPDLLLFKRHSGCKFQMTKKCWGWLMIHY